MKKVLITSLLLTIFFSTSVFASDMEGSGFSSPEGAVSAYIEGLQNNNLNQMVSAYAVEIYVENYELSKSIEQSKGYSTYMNYIPSISDFSLQLNYEQRRSSITKSILNHYLVLTNSNSIEYANSFVGFSSPDETGLDLQNKLFTTNDSQYLSNISFSGEFYDPSIMIEGFPDESTQQFIQSDIETMNANNIESVVCKLTCNDAHYLLCMETVQYGDKWYILNAGGRLSSYLGIDSYCSGLMLLLPEEVELLNSLDQ